MFRLYACVKQHDATDCGAACLATIARTHKLRVDVATIRRYAGAGVQGTNVVELIQAAKQIGFEARGIRAAPDELYRISLPCIAHVVIGSLEHYIVLHRITPRRVTIADPARGIRRIRIEGFLQIWTGVLIQLVPVAMVRTRFRPIAAIKRIVRLLRHNVLNT